MPEPRPLRVIIATRPAVPSAAWGGRGPGIGGDGGVSVLARAEQSMSVGRCVDVDNRLFTQPERPDSRGFSAVFLFPSTHLPFLILHLSVS